jgi:hypothetical protein
MRKYGNAWIIRFWTGDKMEADIITEAKGCQHYQRLLTTPYKTIECIDLDLPTKAEVTISRSAVEQDVYRQAYGDENARKARILNDALLNDLHEQIDDYKNRIEHEPDKEERKRLRGIKKHLQDSFNDELHKIENEIGTRPAYNKVKKAMADAQRKMERSNKLPMFLKHLESIQRLGLGYQYAPDRDPHWQI